VIVDCEKSELSEQSPARNDALISGLISLNDAVDPDGPCPACGSGQWWQLPGEPWHCRACGPDMPLTATTLTLPCHKVELRPVVTNVGLERMLEVACQGLSITPEQLRHELEEDGDLFDLACGALTPKAFWLTAKTLALMRYRPENERCLR
jgi:hypothetical protein